MYRGERDSLLDRKETVCWTGKRQSVGQERDNLLDRKETVIWTGKRQSVGQERDSLLDSDRGGKTGENVLTNRRETVKATQQTGRALRHAVSTCIVFVRHNIYV